MDSNLSNDGDHISGSKKARQVEVPSPILAAKRIAFMAGNTDFRAARTRCALACEEYNNLKEDAPVEDRVKAWLRIVDPDNEGNNSTRSTSAVDFSSLFNRGPNSPSAATPKDDDTPPVTPTAPAAASSALATRPTVPYIKKPIYIDYGLRVRIAPTTFINRNCLILDTPVADVVIGEKCSIGPGVTIISVGHSVKFEERCEFESGKAGSWGARVVIEEGVWVGAGATILPGITIGSYSTIGAGSLVNRDIPPRCVATGSPATIRYFVNDKKASATLEETAHTLEDALKAGYENLN